jgi:hypothetical protein
MVVTAVDAPRGYRRLLAPLPRGARIRTGMPRGRAPLELIHWFVTERRALIAKFRSRVRALGPAGMLWISWPKGASAVATDLTETVVREIGLAQGLVDVKVCAVDATWSALKFVRRLEDR